MESRACLCINNIEAYYAGETPDVFTAKAEELKTYPFTLPQVDEAEAGKCADKDACHDLLCGWQYAFDRFRYGTDCFFLPLSTRSERVLTKD